MRPAQEPVSKLLYSAHREAQIHSCRKLFLSVHERLAIVSHMHVQKKKIKRFILGYVPANLGQLAKNNHKTFLSESQLLDNLIDLEQQTTRHILKNKKLNDAEHFTLKHQQQA